jgi:hypothetical protein
MTIFALYVAGKFVNERSAKTDLAASYQCCLLMVKITLFAKNLEPSFWRVLRQIIKGDGLVLRIIPYGASNCYLRMSPVAKAK